MCSYFFIFYLFIYIHIYSAIRRKLKPGSLDAHWILLIYTWHFFTIWAQDFVQIILGEKTNINIKGELQELPNTDNI